MERSRLLTRAFLEAAEIEAETPISVGLLTGVADTRIVISSEVLDWQVAAREWFDSRFAPEQRRAWNPRELVFLGAERVQPTLVLPYPKETHVRVRFLVFFPDLESCPVGELATCPEMDGGGFTLRCWSEATNKQVQKEFLVEEWSLDIRTVRCVGERPFFLVEREVEE